MPLRNYLDRCAGDEQADGYVAPSLAPEPTAADMRYFASGATRNSKDGKLAYTGFLSPLVLQRYAKYMHQHRRQADGQLRAPDNWKKGMPIPEYLESMGRHFFDAWLMQEGYEPAYDEEETLCAIMFNAMGWLHEILVVKRSEAWQGGIPSAGYSQDSVESATASASMRAE